jgi:uncharacterized protein YjiS (DUF1127 family)
MEGSVASASLGILWHSPSRAGRSAGLARIVLDALCAWHERRRQREHLLTLDERMLHDIGLTSVDVEREFSKPFWAK